MALAARHALIEQRQFDVLHGRLETYEVERLEDEAYHAVAILGRTRLREVLDERPCQAVLALVVVVEDA